MVKAFITDLDRTIIHSKNPGFVSVERVGDKDITYMTERSINLLNDLLRKDDFLFIPCTMRQKHKTLRVDFIREYNPKYMICENGAQIYIDGELDSYWEQHMRSLVNSKDVEEGIEKINSLKLNTRSVLSIDGYYIAISFYDDDYASECFEDIASLFDAPFCTVQVGRKMFVIHEKIDKVHAVEYLINKIKLENFILSGDSDVDESFTAIGDAILPRHASFRHNDAAVTGKRGIYATEDILRYVMETFYS